jgi:hypothetical protein
MPTIAAEGLLERFRMVNAEKMAASIPPGVMERYLKRGIFNAQLFYRARLSGCRI